MSDKTTGLTQDTEYLVNGENVGKLAKPEKAVRPPGDMWRVDVAGYPVSVRGEAARDHLQQTDERLVKMKMALHRICKLHPDTDTMNIARDGLYQ